jgi:hypothetical protein
MARKTEETIQSAGTAVATATGPADGNGDKPKRARKSKAPAETKLTHTAQGQGFLPSAEPVAVAEIIDFVQDHENTKRLHKECTTQLAEQNNDAIALFRKHKQYFEDDGEGNWVYNVAGNYLRISKPGELKVTTKIIPTETPE